MRFFFLLLGHNACGSLVPGTPSTACTEHRTLVSFGGSDLLALLLCEARALVATGGKEKKKKSSKASKRNHSRPEFTASTPAPTRKGKSRGAQKKGEEVYGFLITRQTFCFFFCLAFEHTLLFPNFSASIFFYDGIEEHLLFPVQETNRRGFHVFHSSKLLFSIPNAAGS